RAIRTPTPFFFFQAEDGIRDATVTGVQTCALPIFSPAFVASPRTLDGAVRRVVERRRPRDTLLHGRSMEAMAEIVGVDDDDILRSEERRVGKEWKYKELGE